MKRFMFILLIFLNFYAYGKPLIIGVPEFAPPFVSRSGGGEFYFGFNIDLMNSICKIIEMECQYKGMNIQQLYTNLNEGKVDIMLAPTPIVSTADSDYIFSLPYLPSNAQVVTLKANDDINALKDLKGKKVGTLKYTLYGSLLQEHFQDYFDLIEFSKLSDMAIALSNQKIEAIVLNANAAKYAMSNSSTELKLVGDKIPIGNGYGILALKNNAPLIMKINTALLQIEKDGTYLEIYNTYFSD
ncbi:TPA: transporter substrate-binding domain-containing protein [Legionella pneumophila]|uniref:transporter substrate-binding domain-containing protein n=1 Tax=Legionella pneumophila TaxID=446 RepID=UPI0007875B9A|nr:transporter substrate-binding domain-containing protein [Legionella pneumophila]MDW9167162.1 transporter substrate-binding domain-containing protein [Legionella pneumophila subsp. fraseri]MDX1845652.1 transporter substrate-binding domain-containing protein [Legionella pneumophila subsp. fraseri]HAT1658697.1 transporter substrate-binding domain-containing protein [Legionella pneumophila]HAT1771602.1 transporter substrate-binding domain-containing protein [Legionella pneumophila]HAT1845836.1 